MSKEKETVRVSHLPEHGPLDENGREILLSLKNVDITFGKGDDAVRAVKNASFDIYKGETFGLVGESGSGKTTIGRAIIRINPAAKGEIRFKGERISGKISKELDHKITQEIQMIFQDPMASLNERAKVDYIVSEGLMNIHPEMSKAERDQRVAQALLDVGLLPEFASRFPHEFSGGQRQRIGIARALALNPEFIVCDEPISALDVSIQAHIINILEDFQHRFNLTYLFISHDLSMVRHISHRVGVMYLGHLVEVAEVNDLYENMRHPYTVSLMSAAPIADPNVARNTKRVILQGDVPSPINPPSGCPFRTRCQYADEICAHVMPQLEEVSKGHIVACHHML